MEQRIETNSGRLHNEAGRIFLLYAVLPLPPVTPWRLNAYREQIGNRFQMFHVKHFSLFAFVYKIIFAAANIICRGAAPADPAKGVPPFGTLLRALRGRIFRDVRL